MSYKWNEWVQRLQALSQSGLTFTDNPFEIERYKELRNIAAEIASEYSKHSFKEAEQYFSRDWGYATPKVEVRGAVFREGKILLVKEIADGKWTIPGGFCDVGISPKENVIKEVKEESGYDIEVIKPIAIIDRNKHFHGRISPFHLYKIFFLCRITGGVPMRSIETDGVNFFSINELPELSISRVNENQMKMMFEYNQNSNKELYFD